MLRVNLPPIKCLIALAGLLSVTDWCDAQRWRLPTSQGRNGSKIAEASAPAIHSVQRSVVKIRDGEMLVALGTIVRADGWILTKASTLPTAGSCELVDGRNLPIGERRLLPEHDLALVKIAAQELPSLDWRPERPATVIPGRWVVTATPDHLPVVGVIGGATRTVRAQPAFLGVELEDTETGPVVSRVIPNSAAARAGFKVSDRVSSADGESVSNRRDLIRAIRRQNPGTTLGFVVARGDKEIAVTAVLGQPAGDDEEFENAGPVSLRRSGFPAAFQHDGPVPPEHCGGPVASLDGEWLGINVARANRTATFSIPASTIREILIAQLTEEPTGTKLDGESPDRP